MIDISKNPENSNPEQVKKQQMIERINGDLVSEGYEVVEFNGDKPWGAYFRLHSGDSDKFIAQFFPGLSSIEARLGVEGAELSPKILLVSPGHRLSWQYHNRRAERWRFLSDGYYAKSPDDEQSEFIKAEADDVVQFEKGERHRLIASDDDFTLVAEIWQHTEGYNLSDESDIIRLQDDYNR